MRWDDLVRGPCHYHAGNLSDPVLIRADGSYLYTLPSVVDDAEMAISHVIRGEDHVTNTAVQIQIFEALGAAVPVFGHLTLLTDAKGEGLSKRLGSMSLGELRQEGIEAMALNSLLAKLGTADAIHPLADLDALAAGFDLGRFSRATPKFDPAELERVNAHLLHGLSFVQAEPRLRALGLPADEAFWLAVRANLARMDEARDWWHICREPVAPQVEDAAFLAQARALLPEGDWNAETWKTWTQALAAASGRKGKALFHPLRLALTGRENGPELKTLLPLIGKDRAAARLCGQTA